MKKLVIFTSSYPYSIACEDAFLEPELEVLKKYFRITLIPLIARGSMATVSKDICVMDDFGHKKIFTFKNLTKAVLSRHLYAEIIKKPSILLSLKMAKNLFWHTLRASNLLHWLEKESLSADIFYTYWFDYATTALLWNAKDSKCDIVTKAHGYDLYASRWLEGYIPFRDSCVEEISKVFLISRDGHEYLSNNYPQCKSKFVFAPMGTKDVDFLVKKSSDDVFRFVSCSYVLPVKRVDLTIEVLFRLSELVDKRLEWFHIGGGDALDETIRFAKKKLDGKVKYSFLGNVENKKIFEFYKKQPLDMFIMLSESEGKPVALMEAASVGLPIVATAVGGIPEIVIDGENGLLVSKNAYADEIAKAIAILLSMPEKIECMKEKSFNIWQDTANASLNFESFACKLSN